MAASQVFDFHRGTAGLQYGRSGYLMGCKSPGSRLPDRHGGMRKSHRVRSNRRKAKRRARAKGVG